MRYPAAAKLLAEWDWRGRCVFLKRDLAKVFGESGKTLDQTLRRLIAAGLLERVAHGVYVYALSAHLGVSALEEVALALRRGEFVFESYESALSQWGRISQVPVDRITLATTGREGVFRTRFGVIEFTHTAAGAAEIATNTVARPGRVIPIATEAYALSGLRRTGRNLDLVDQGV